jgi:hypothetical protein
MGALPSDQSFFDVTGAQVAGKLDIEGTGSTDGSVENSTAGELYLKLDGIQGDLMTTTLGTGLTVSDAKHKIEILLSMLHADSGSLSLGASASDYSVFDVSGSQVAHKLDIETTGITDGSVENTTVGGLNTSGDLFLKIDSMGEICDLTAANGVTVGGGLTVSADKGHDGWVELNGVQADDIMVSKATPKLFPGSSWSWGVSNSSIAHKLDIEATGTTDGSIENCTAGGLNTAGEVYLNLDGMQADLTGANGVTVGGLVLVRKAGGSQQEWSAVQAVDFLLKLPPAAHGSSFDISGSQVTHKLDIETTGTTDGSVENSGGGEIYLKLDGILADLASDSGAANGTVGGVLTVSTHGTIHKAEVHDISFDSFTLKMGSSAADRSVLDVSGSQVTHKLDIESAVGRMSCTAEANTAGDLTLNFAKVEYELTAPVGGVVSQDTLAVSLAPGALSMTADGVQAGGMNLKLTSPSAQTPSNIQLSDINLSGQLKVTSLGPSSFYLGPAKTGSPQTGGGPSFGLLATDMFFTATNLPGPQPGPSQIKLSDAMITGQLQIIGGGNDTIAVAGTSVGGTAQFDGGGGLRNKLNIAGNQFASPPVIVHFATATQ